MGWMIKIIETRELLQLLYTLVEATEVSHIHIWKKDFYNFLVKEIWQHPERRSNTSNGKYESYTKFHD